MTQQKACSESDSGRTALLTVLSILLALAISIPSASGLQRTYGDLIITVTLDMPSYLPRTQATLTVNVTNTSGGSRTAQLKYVSVDWDNTNYYTPLGVTGTQVLSAYQTIIHVFQLTTPNQPGYHTIHVYMSVGALGDVGLTERLLVLDPFLEVADNLLTSVGAKLANASNTLFQNPLAQSSLSKAQSEYNLAQALYTAGLYSDAIDHLIAASHFIDDAFAHESTPPQQVSLQPLALGGVVLLLSILAAVILRGRNAPSKRSL